VFAAPRVKSGAPLPPQVGARRPSIRTAVSAVILLVVIGASLPMASGGAVGHPVRSESTGSSLSANVTYDDLGGSWNCGQGYQTFEFFGHVAGGVAPYTYNWTFGDGTNASAVASPTHTFSRFGQFLVNVSVRDSAGTWLNASVSPVWGIPLFCSSPPVLSPLGVFGLALYLALIFAIVIGAFLLVRARRRRPLPEPPGPELER
jgi:PKD domain